MKKKKKRRPHAFLGFPSEIVTGCPKITVIGCERMLVENHKGVFEISQSIIRIITTYGLLNINGNDLIIKELNESSTIIEGIITKCEYENSL